jgi:hypothetical protein
MQKFNIIKSPPPQQSHHNAKVFFNNKHNTPLLCYIVKHFFYIPPVLVVWWHTISQTGAFGIDSSFQQNHMHSLTKALFIMAEFLLCFE